MSQQTELIERTDHGLVSGLLFVVNSTGVCHIIDNGGETACRLLDCDLDHVQERQDGKVSYGPSPYSNWHRGVIHEDGRKWVRSRHRLCSFCDDAVEDELQAELFDTDTFGNVDDLTTEVVYE